MVPCGSNDAVLSTGDVTLAATSQESVEVADIVDKIIADTGASHDFIDQAHANHYPLAHILAPTVRLSTANHVVKASNALNGTVDHLGSDPSPFYILKSTPTALSVGARVMDDGFTFVWLNGRRPRVVCPSGAVVILDVIKNVPYFNSQCISTTFDDPAVYWYCVLVLWGVYDPGDA